ncbi:MAG TPA: EAL domain-containing protein, partial [Longimicrobiaceae bacterium]|nr:EAL domain-containing protein [Longimicrobiaceae bacterium]
LPVARERVVDEMRDGVVVLDDSDRVLDLNPAARGIFGLTGERMVGRPATEVIGALAGRIGSGGEGSTLQVTLESAGEERSYEVRVSPLTDRGGHLTGRLLVLRDATERMRMEGELWHNAFYDSLTGLANRALFRDRLELAVHRAKRGGHPFAVFFLDLNRFKVINDSLGHAVGDELLVTVSRRLEACLRPSDTVARLGGDEFAVLLEEVEGVEDATRVAERMQAAISEPIRLPGHEVVTSASIGVALGPVPEGDAELLLRNADMAMYRAKESRVLHYAVFDRAMHEQAVERLRLESELRRAVERDELRLHYQPIVATETERVVCFEALLRWEHPERGLLDPPAFIRIAEETGLIVSIGEWVLREGCRRLREWQQRFPAAAPALTVNLSTRELAHPELVSAVERTLQEAPPLPGTLYLEITEDAMVESPEALERVLAHLAGLGIRFSMDDFGTGYSSLSHLHRLPVHTVKIGRSFIARMGSDAEAREIVRTLVSLARALRMEVVAEGVETEAQRAELRAFGCEYLQGYLVSGPLTVEDAEELLQGEQARVESGAASAG